MKRQKRGEIWRQKKGKKNIEERRGGGKLKNGGRKK